MDWQDVIALTIAAGAVWLVIRSLAGSLSGRSGCGCSQTKPGASGGKCVSKGATGVKHIPVVTPEQIGRPFETAATKEPED